MGSALFGGFCVTGTIARTATNVRAGSRGPVSGMLHALFLLGFLMVAAPMAGLIPLAALAGVLAVVAWGMAERHEFISLLRSSRGDALVVGVTFLLVVFRDLTEGIVVGFALAGIVFIRRMSETVEMREDEDLPDTSLRGRPGRLSHAWPLFLRVGRAGWRRAGQDRRGSTGLCPRHGRGSADRQFRGAQLSPACRSGAAARRAALPCRPDRSPTPPA
jgi:Sulfate permease family